MGWSDWCVTSKLVLTSEFCLPRPMTDIPKSARPMAKNASDALVEDKTAGLPRLLEIMRRLRDPESGCPWDIEQDFKSIAPYTIEEAYEVADAIEQGDMDNLRDELGDLLLQSVYHAQMAEEINAFSFADVVNSISDKMLNRHPHVFGAESRDKTPEQQVQDWEKIKAKERGAKQSKVLDGVAAGLPALTRAVKLQNRAARVGFDWPDSSHVIAKIVEEAQELEEAKAIKTQADIEEEFGDLMFVMANLARHLDIDPEGALRAANQKFIRRFNRVEHKTLAAGGTLESSSLEEMDALWDEVKAEEKIS